MYYSLVYLVFLNRTDNSIEIDNVTAQTMSRNMTRMPEHVVSCSGKGTELKTGGRDRQEEQRDSVLSRFVVTEPGTPSSPQCVTLLRKQQYLLAQNT